MPTTAPPTDEPDQAALLAELAQQLADAHARHAGDTTTLGAYRPCPPGFWRSKSGSLCRRLDDGALATVFRHKGDDRTGFGWCISHDERGPWFSDEVYDDEGEAVAALLYELGLVDPDELDGW